MNDGLRLVGENLFTIESETHRRHRRLIQPAFHWERLRRYAEIMVDESDKLSDTFEGGVARDVSVDMAQLTLGVAVRALFGTDLPEDVRVRITAYVRDLLAPWFNREGARLATFESEAYRETLAASHGIVEEMIRERRADPGGRTDLLTMLLAARGEDGSGLTDTEVRDEVAALIVAGHETTSTTLTWAWYLLSEHPDVDARMHDEIVAILGDRDPTEADLASLTYVDMVVAECLRLLPTVWGFDRTVIEDHPVGRYLLRAGSTIFVSPFVVHRDPRWYPDPERFDPERWSGDLRKSRPRYAYLPFGGGPRMCIGQPFALMEATLVLATLRRRWRLRLEPGFVVEREGGVTLRPKHGMRMIPERVA